MIIIYYSVEVNIAYYATAVWHLLASFVVIMLRAPLQTPDSLVGCCQRRSGPPVWRSVAKEHPKGLNGSLCSVELDPMYMATPPML